MRGLLGALMIANASPAPLTSRTVRVEPSDITSFMYAAGQENAIGTVRGRPPPPASAPLGCSPSDNGPTMPGPTRRFPHGPVCSTHVVPPPLIVFVIRAGPSSPGGSQLRNLMSRNPPTLGPTYGTECAISACLE